MKLAAYLEDPYLLGIMAEKLHITREVRDAYAFNERLFNMGVQEAKDMQWEDIVKELREIRATSKDWFNHTIRRKLGDEWWGLLAELEWDGERPESSVGSLIGQHFGHQEDEYTTEK